MKTKIFTLLFAIVASIGTIYAYSTYSIGEIDGIWYDYDQESGTAIVAYAGSNLGHERLYEDNEMLYEELKYRDSIYIPSSIPYRDGTPVTEIGDHAFYNCYELTYVSIPNSIIKIGEHAFDMSGVTSITIPNSITSIEDYAFASCGSLSTVTILNSAASIGNNAFYNCYNLASIELGDNITTIGDYAFAVCNSLTSITIPQNVTSVGTDAFMNAGLTSVVWNAKNSIIKQGWNSYSPFYNAGGITSFTFGDEVEVIPGFLCSAQKGITSITIPYSVDSIGELAFSGCISLMTLNIPNSIKKIENRAFSGCTGLTSVNIGNGLKKIEQGMFEGCTDLCSVTIGGSIETIGYQAFSGCSSLPSVIIPNGVKTIDSEAFAGCSNLTLVNIPDGVTHIGGSAFIGCGFDSIRIPDNVTYIGMAAFDGTNLKTVTIPENVDTIGRQAFAYCKSLKSVTWNAKKATCDDTGGSYNGRFFDNSPVRKFIVGEQVDSLPSIFYNYTNFGNGTYYLDTVVWKAIDYNKTEHYASRVLSGLEIGNLLFGNKVEYITDYLCGSSYIKSKSINIPNSVKTIGTMAFSDCSELQSVVIGNGVTTIGANAFTYCALKSLIIGNSVTTIEEGAFYENWDLKSATCYAATPPAFNSAFDDWRKLDIYVPVNSVNAYKAADGWKEHNIYPIGATPTTTSGITVNSSDYSVNITWSSTSGATSYELVVKDKSGNVVCRVTFDANGKLLSIAFHAPARNGMPQYTQEAGFSYTLIGLDSGTEYDVTITAKNAGGSALDVQTISFTTKGEPTERDIPHGIDEIDTDNAHGIKVMKDGQILILRGDKTYTLQGQEVK